MAKMATPKVFPALAPVRAAAAVTAVMALMLCGASQATLLTLDGATFDAPAACQLTGGALVCKEDGQQLELWVYRAPLKAAAGETRANKMLRVSEIHQNALKNIAGAAGTDAAKPFSSYGKYVVNGSMLAGKGSVSAPSVRLATLLNGEDVWQMVEVVAVRTPRIEALTASLQRSVTLPFVLADAAELVDGSTANADRPATAANQAGRVVADPALAKFEGKLLSFQYANTLELVVIEDSNTTVSVGLRHKARSGGPNITISARATKNATANEAAATIAVDQRKQQSISAMMPGSATVEVKKLGAIAGTGYALIGTPDASKGFSGIESIETMFAADASGRLLEVRLTAEQKYASDMEAAWTLLGQTIKLNTP
jgi:hypothetical protein